MPRKIVSHSASKEEISFSKWKHSPAESLLFYQTDWGGRRQQAARVVAVYTPEENGLVIIGCVHMIVVFCSRVRLRPHCILPRERERSIP